MNLLENWIVEIYSEKIIKHPQFGEIYEVSLKVNCYGVENVTTQWFTEDQWKTTIANGFYMG